MSNSIINATYTSVYIDKDEDFLTNQNETFEYSEHPPSFTTSKMRINRFTTSSMSIKRATPPKAMRRKVVCKRKFYRWSSIDVHLLSSSKKIAQAQRLGLVRRKKEEENTSPSPITFKLEHDDLPSFLSLCITNKNA